MVTRTKTQTRSGNRDQTERMLRTGEACQILCIHSNTLRRWSEQGIIRAYRLGPRGDRRFRLEDVTALFTAEIRLNSDITGE
jgi:excisionase family DNA binding protein